MDAMGVKHRIPMAMARTFEVCAPLVLSKYADNANNSQQFKRVIGAVYTPKSRRDVVHHRYLDADQFNLGIDNGHQVMQITSDKDLQKLVQPSTTIVLGVIILRRRRIAEKYRCPLCWKWNEKMAVQSAAEW
jgi:hypothetical protein